MPFRSEAQRRYFYANPKLHKYIAEFNAATPKHLPARVGLVQAIARKKNSNG